jgi:hypothetical protein
VRYATATGSFIYTMRTTIRKDHGYSERWVYETQPHFLSDLEFELGVCLNDKELLLEHIKTTVGLNWLAITASEKKSSQVLGKYD